MSKYQLKAPILELTRRCNLSCAHCGSSCKNDEPDDELSLDEWSNVIYDLRDMRVEKLVYSGGEATLSPHFMGLVHLAHVHRISYGFITNGWNISDWLIKYLQSSPPFAVGVSLDGRAMSHNRMRGSESFIRAVDTLRRLKEAGIKTAVVTTLNSFNCDELVDLAPLLVKLGVDAWQIQLAMPMGRMKDHTEYLIDPGGDQKLFKQICFEISRLRRSYPMLRMTTADCFGMDSLGSTKGEKWQGCSAGIYTLGIKSNGDVLPCLSLYDDRFVCGNVRKESIKSIWDNPDNFKFNRQFNPEQVDDSSRCKHCELLDRCRGGCASMSQSFFGHYHDSPFCVDRKFNLV